MRAWVHNRYDSLHREVIKMDRKIDKRNFISLIYPIEFISAALEDVIFQRNLYLSAKEKR